MVISEQWGFEIRASLDFEWTKCNQFLEWSGFQMVGTMAIAIAKA